MSNYKDRLIEMRKVNIKRIKDQVNILDLAKQEGYHIVPHGKLFRMEEHSSCVFYLDKNAYRRFSREYEIPEGKSVYKDVFQFLQEFKGMSFNEAYNYLLKGIDPEKPITQREVKQKKERLSDQQRTKSLQNQIKQGVDPHCKNAIAYLIKIRHIHPQIAFEFANKKLIQQQTNQFGSKNLVMLGYDEKGMLAAAEYKGCSTSSSARGDFKDCDYRYGWFYDPETEPSSFFPEIHWDKPCIITEANIDRMALMSLMLDGQLDPVEYGFDETVMALLKSRDYNYKSFNWLSIGSTSNRQTVYSLMDKFHIQNWIVATDNDESGHKCAGCIIQEVEKRGGKAYSMFSLGKDWDQDRINQCEKSLDKRIQRGEVACRVDRHCEREQDMQVKIPAPER